MRIAIMRLILPVLDRYFDYSYTIPTASCKFQLNLLQLALRQIDDIVTTVKRYAPDKVVRIERAMRAGKER
jgi:hypothetical protein